MNPSLFHRGKVRKTRSRARPKAGLAVEQLEARHLLSANLPDIATAISHSAEYYSDFVTNAYQHYLGRQPDQGGLAAWVNQMQQGLSDEHLEAAFIGSAEYISNHGGTGAAWVQGLYEDELGRAPDAVGLQYWENALAAGASPDAIAYGFAASAEREGQRITNDYMTYLGRAPEAGAVDSWVQAFEQGTSNEDVVAGFISSPEFYNKIGLNSDSTWLLSVYSLLLNRMPSTDDFQDWLGESASQMQSELTSSFSATPSVQAAQSLPTGQSTEAVVELVVTFPDNQVYVGTGAMIDPFHVVTAAHLLYSAADGGYAASIEAIPDGNGTDAPYGAAWATYERVDPSWIGFSAANPGMTSPTVNDVGLVTLNQAIGESTGWFSLAYKTSNNFFNGATFVTAGYPSIPGSSGPQMLVESGTAEGSVSGNGIAFAPGNLNAFPGQSGSPIFQTTGYGAGTIYGILTGSNGLPWASGVYATQITPNVYSELQSWMAADAFPSFYSSGAPASVQHPALTGGTTSSGSPSGPVIKALDAFYGGIGEINAYTGTSLYNYYNQDGVWSSQYYSSPYGGYSFDTPDWYQDMANDGYYRLGEVNAYTGNSNYNYYNSDQAYAGYSYLYNYDTSDW